MGEMSCLNSRPNSNAFKELYKHTQVSTHASLAVGNGVSVLALFVHFVMQKLKQRQLIGGTLVKALV